MPGTSIAMPQTPPETARAPPGGPADQWVWAAAGTHGAAGARTAALGGTWGTAIEVPGTAALNQRGNAWLSSVSCASPGNCSAGGYYTPSEFLQEAFVVNETSQ